ncbi:MAG: 50S ribosomal protein L9 [Patescibacteria group bacterium]|nr:50S ribosomal protein L9 [Patescibacteria group bacterium]
MRIILNKDVKNLGQRGDLKSVKPGYFRNFLYPQGFAVIATPALLKAAAALVEKRAIEKDQIVKEAKEIIKKFKGLKIEISKKITSKGKLYAALQEKDVIAAILNAVNVKLVKDNLKMEHIKEEGDHEVTVILTEGVSAKITVSVKKEES